MYAHLANARTAKQLQTPPVEAFASATNDFACFHILASQAHVPEGFCAIGDFDDVTLHARVLLHHHGVGAGGHWRAGKNPHALARTHFVIKGTACRHFADVPKLCAFARISSTHGIAIHRGIIKARQIHCRQCLAGQHTTSRLRQRHSLRRQRRDDFQYFCLSLLHSVHRFVLADCAAKVTPIALKYG